MALARPPNETRGNEKLDRRQKTAPVVYILAVDNFEDLGTCFLGQTPRHKKKKILICTVAIFSAIGHEKMN